MGIITISRGSYSYGKEIAEKLASNLGYECISRDILLEASEHFHIPELKLSRIIHDAPTLLDKLNYTKERYIAYISNAFFEHIQRDNIVYHGLAGQFFVQGVPNILKVRIIANFEDRVKEEMRRENISENEARQILQKDDEERKKWSMHLYGIDTNDPSLYDIVLHIDNVKVDEAVEILSDAARRPCFQTSAESETALQDHYLATKVKVALAKSFPNTKVRSENGAVNVNIEQVLSAEKQLQAEISNISRKVNGVKEVKVNVIPIDID